MRRGCRRSPSRSRSTATGDRAAVAFDVAAGALHRGEPRQGARGARHRAAVDVRIDPRHDPGPRLRVQARDRAGAVVHGVRRRRAARAALRAAGRLRLHRSRWRTTSTRSRAARRSRRAWLTRFYFGDDSSTAEDPHGLKELVTDRLGEIDAREVNSLPVGDAEDGELVVARVGRYGPYVQKGDLRASIPDDMPPDELTVERAISAAQQDQRRAAARPAPRDQRADPRAHRPVRPVRHDAAARWRRGQDRVAVQGHGRRVGCRSRTR